MNKYYTPKTKTELIERLSGFYPARPLFYWKTKKKKQLYAVYFNTIKKRFL